MIEFFGRSEEEQWFYNSVNTYLSNRLQQRDTLNANAWVTYRLGGSIHDSSSSPLVTAIQRFIFREAFAEIFQAFIDVGTAEAYLVVFRRIFGDTVDVQFTIPDPGVLEIDIIADGFILYDIICRQIVDNEYTTTELIDDEGNNIGGNAVQGFQTQSELENMLREMVPSGIFPIISLTIGSEE